MKKSTREIVRRTGGRGTVQLWLTQITKLGLLLMMAVSMNTEAGLFGRSNGWKEEVQIHDGSILVVERTYKLADYLIPGSSEPPAQDENLAFTLPGSNKRISWKTDYRNDLPEPNSLTPLLLDIVGGIPYLATSPAGCISYNKWGRPNPPYILFKYENEKWERIPLEAFPPELTRANLMSRPSSDMLKPYYTVEQARSRMEGGNIVDYARTILRKPLTKERINEMCVEMVFYKGYWIMPNDPVARRMVDMKVK